MLQVKNKQKLKRKWRKRPVLTGLLKFEIMKDRRPDRGLGPYRSYYFAVLIGPGPVQSRSFSGPETGPPSTNLKRFTRKEFYSATCGLDQENPFKFNEDSNRHYMQSYIDVFRRCSV